VFLANVYAGHNDVQWIVESEGNATRSLFCLALSLAAHAGLQYSPLPLAGAGFLFSNRRHFLPDLQGRHTGSSSLAEIRPRLSRDSFRFLASLSFQSLKKLYSLSSSGVGSAKRLMRATVSISRPRRYPASIHHVSL